MIFANRC